MNKRELLQSLIDSSATPETVPAAFFLHFDPAYHRGQAAVDKHMEYFRATGMDFVKIQFELRFPKLEIEKPGDWSKVPCYDLDSYAPQLEVVRGLVEAGGSEALVLLTLYSPFMLACHTAGADTVARHAQEAPEAFKRGISTITDSLLGFVRECVRLGLDGFYASTQGGESGRFSNPETFTECVRPFDLAVMEELERICRFNILHVCDYHLPYDSLEPFTDYPGHVVNTSLELTGRTMEPAEVARMFGRPFMGGLERKGVLATGSTEAIRAEADRVLDAAPERFILAADCTVPAETPWEHLKTAIAAAHARGAGGKHRGGGGA